MSNQRVSKTQFLYTGNYNIRCLTEKISNNFEIKNNKIFFDSFTNTPEQPIDYLAIFKQSFRFISKNDNLLFGLTSNNPIQINSINYVKTITINNKNVDLYRKSAEFICKNVVPLSFFYVVDENNKIYKLPIIFNELCERQNCEPVTYQSYGKFNFGKENTFYYFSELANRINCMKSSVYRNRLLNHQQNLYAMMRRFPEKFPIISSVKQINLTLAQQRQYSNMWYRQFGTSQALPVNDNFGGFYLVGSDVPYTN